MQLEITPQELQDKISKGEDVCLLDVRSEEEFNLVNLSGLLIPLDELPQRFNELDPEQYIVVYCHHGIRSAQAAMFLIQQGFDHVQNLKGGIDKWALEIDPQMLRY